MPRYWQSSIGELLVSVSEESLDQLSGQVQRTNTRINIANLSAIEDIRPYSRDEALRGTSIKAIRQWSAIGHKVRVTLFQYKNEAADSALFAAFLKWARGHRVTQRRDSFSRQSIDFILDPPEDAGAIDDLTRLVGVRSILPVPVFYSLDIGVHMTPISPATTLNCPPPTQDTDYPVVGIIDSGVAPDAPLLSPWIHAARNYVADADADTRHGTFVAGLIAAARPLDHGAQEFPDSPCKILDVRALSTHGANEDDLKALILESVRAHPEVRVWNLSLGAKVPCDETAFGSFAQFLDGRRRAPTAAINSLRVAMLICLATIYPRRTIRRVANYMRQQHALGNKKGESMRRPR
jgi:serine protease AprX